MMYYYSVRNDCRYGVKNTHANTTKPISTTISWYEDTESKKCTIMYKSRTGFEYLQVTHQLFAIHLSATVDDNIDLRYANARC